MSRRSRVRASSTGTGSANPRALRCAIYTRVSTDQGLEQDFNSLDAQREACAAYIRSQAQEGWVLVPTPYDDGGYSGGNLDRPALKALLVAVAAKRIDVIVVYKVDRLTRSLADFAKLVEAFDAAGVSFISITQSFNTTTSMGRLTLNMLLSFAQFEREVTGERIRDKIAASKKKGIWVGGVVPLGYRVLDRKLIVDGEEAKTVRIDLRPLSRTGLARAVDRRASPEQDLDPSSDACVRTESRRRPVHEGTARLSAQEPDVPRRDQPRREQLSRRASGDHRQRRV